MQQFCKQIIGLKASTAIAPGLFGGQTMCDLFNLSS
jgi:hypothetical protein